MQATTATSRITRALTIVVVVVALVAVAAAAGTDATPNTANAAAMSSRRGKGKGKKNACAAPKQKCGDACVDVDASHEHCGKCFVPCPQTQMCFFGKCINCPIVGAKWCDFPDGPKSVAVTSAAAPQVDVYGKCVNLASDPNSCGMCGFKCVSGASCVNGVCVCPSSTLQTLTACPAPTGCTDLQIDELNCGACSKMCSRGQTCTRGVCVGP